MEQLKEKITVPNIIKLFIILQPIIDIITCLCIEYGNLSITFGVIIRTIFMAFCAILGIIKADKKYKIGMCIYYGILAVYMIGFLANSYIENGTNLIFTQIKGLVKNFYLPIILVALIPIFKHYKIHISKKTLTIALMIYVITIFVASITGIAMPTYKGGDKAGTVGLFYSANEIGAILCLLSPFFIIRLIEQKIAIHNYICIFLLSYAILELGTKVPYFGFIILLLCMIFTCCLYAKINKKKELYKKAAGFLGLLIAVYLITGLTPVGQNLTKIYGDIFIITTEDLQFGKDETPPQITEFKDFEELKTVAVSGRNDFLKANKEKFVNGNVLDKTLGIGFVENVDGKYEELKLIEMDYYDILFCNGILGTILFASPILALGIYLIYKTIANKSKIKMEYIYFIGMMGIVALLAGHVLVSPAVSIYIAIVLLKYDSEIIKKQTTIIKEEKNEEDNNTCAALIDRRS